MSKSDASSYRKVSHREHVLLRPAGYLGSMEPEACSAWVPRLDAEGGACVGMERRDDVQYVPGLLKVFDEIIVNAIDHATRTRQQADASSAVQVVKKIEVEIDRETGVLSVANDGESIPVQKHAEHGDVWVPELIFGHLLTSSNYDDDKDRIVGGQNGIGAKACNILSRWFEVEVVDSQRKLKYTQRFEDNMARALPPRVVASAVKRSNVRVRFLPDYARLGMADGRLSDDMHALLVKRVYDATAVTDPDVVVSFNGRPLEVKSFERYVDLYLGPRGATPRAYERVANAPGWEVACALSDGSGLQQVSFVNGIATLRGGRHVDHVVNQICRRVCDAIAARGGGGKGKAGAAAPKLQYVRDNLMVFVRATVPGATFDSLAKDTLTTPVNKFGARVELSDAFVDKVYKLEGLVDRVVGLSGAAGDKELRKTDGAKRSTIVVPKLDDAEWAGTAKSQQCTLLLTEGDSAKASAVAGLSVVGRQQWGVYPLRGKVMNVCDMSADRIAANAEIAAIKKILGLQTGKVYTSTAELRYGRVMLMTDADTDGSHIRGLVINLFLQQWPSLLRIDGFVCSLLTPIVKALPPAAQQQQQRGGGQQPVEFYNMADFERWREANPELAAKWRSKYYKGLGTSTSEEARDWFRRMRKVAYVWAEDCHEALSKAFDKKRADDRKAWLQQYDPRRTLDYGGGDVRFCDFVERDLIHFSNYDVLRSIPSVVDGFKVSQRKAFFGCRRRNLVKGEVRVAQLAAYAAEQACFHHGETSMQGTIIGMAQQFVGCGNNVALLEPIGQFGTRLAGGADWASPRYIHTRLSRLATLLFPPEDDADGILRYLQDDGTPIEPAHYLPILPMVLVNGATGIGTGYSTSVPSYDPMQITRAVRAMLEGGERDAVLGLLDKPWYRGFTGSIETHNGKLRSRGVVSRVPGAPTKVRVTELPIGYWTEDFKEALEGLIERAPDVKSFSNESTDSTVCFVINMATQAAVNAWLAVPASSTTGLSKLEAELKLASPKGLSTTNMHLFNAQGQIQRYETVWDVLHEFFGVRLDGYEQRRAHLIARLRREVDVLRNRVLFVECVVDGRLKLDVGAREGDPEEADGALERDMEALGLERMLPEGSDKAQQPQPQGEDEGEDEKKGDAVGSYRYLLTMPMASMTARRKAELDRQLEARRGDLARAEASRPRDMWSADLDRFEAAYRAVFPA